MPTLINSAMPQTIKVGITFCLSGRLRRTKKPSKKVPAAHTYSPPVSVIQKTQTINNSQRAPLRNSYVLFFEEGTPAVGVVWVRRRKGIKIRGAVCAKCTTATPVDLPVVDCVFDECKNVVEFDAAFVG